MGKTRWCCAKDFFETFARSGAAVHRTDPDFADVKGKLERLIVLERCMGVANADSIIIKEGDSPGPKGEKFANAGHHDADHL